MNRLKILLLLSAVAGLVALAPARAGQGEPPQVIVILPPNSAAPVNLSRQVQRLRANGLIGEAQRFDAVPGQKDHGFATILILHATSEDAALRLEKSQQWPGEARARRVDAAFSSGEIGKAAPESVFEINLYRLKATEQRYQQFVAEYISPLMSAQLDAGLMRSYRMYIERGPEGDRQAILFKAYKDATTYEKEMPDAKLAIRQRLEREHPTYSRWHPIKDEVRYDLNHTVAKQRSE